MKSKLVCIIISAALMLSACGSTTTSNNDTTEASITPTTATTTANPSEPEQVGTRLWIKPDLLDCQGEAPQQCMQIAEAEDGEYEYFYDQIDGFTFVEGTSYVIDVRIDEVEDPPADGSSLAYTLLQIVEEK